MASATNSGKPTSEAVHRRETWLYIFLPMVIFVVLLVVVVLGVISLPQSSQKSLIADWLFTVMFLCPMVLCLFPVVILLVAGVVGLNKAHSMSLRPLRRLQDLSLKLKDRTASTTDTINRRTVDVSVRLAYLERLLSLFDPPPPSSNGTKEEHDV
jgi:cell division septal protein FtsQ